jgi:hypothetical protein
MESESIGLHLFTGQFIFSGRRDAGPAGEYKAGSEDDSGKRSGSQKGWEGDYKKNSRRKGE